METSTAAKLPAEISQQASNIVPGFRNTQGFELMQRAAKLLSSSTLVPKEYQNNLSNCVIALNMSNRIDADPLMVMQNLVIVHGRPTWSSQFMIATVNTCGRFSALRYEFFGEEGKDSWGCRAWAIEKATGEKLTGTDITIAIAKKEGWYSKAGSKWQSIPQQMLMYRAGAWWTRAYAPELSMGLHTADEIQDIIELSPEDYEIQTKREVDLNANGAVIDTTTTGEESNDPPMSQEEKDEILRQEKEEAGKGKREPNF